MSPITKTNVKRSAVRVAILSLVSLGFYQLYWFYLTRQQLDAELGDRRSLSGVGPLVQTLGPPLLALISVPLMLLIVGFITLPVALILSILTWYYLLKDLSRVRQAVKLPPIQPGLYILGYAVLNLVFGGAGVVMMGVAAANFNEYWDKRTKGKATEAPYTTGEIVVSLAGVILVLSLIATVLIGAIAGFFDDPVVY